MVALFILIYLVSIMVHLIVCFRENKYVIHNVGDLIDLTDFYMWFPILNTLLILAVIIGVTIMKLWEISKLNVLWQKFRNIRLK